MFLSVDTLKVKERKKKKKKGQVSVGLENSVQLVFATRKDFKVILFSWAFVFVFVFTEFCLDFLV